MANTNFKCKNRNFNRGKSHLFSTININICKQEKADYPLSIQSIYYWTDITFLRFFSDQKSFYTLLKQLRDHGCRNNPLMVACTFASEDLDAVQDGLSLHDSNRVHLFDLESQTLIQVQDLILSVKWIYFFFFAINHLPPL